jgi:hypothetical protein
MSKRTIGRWIDTMLELRAQGEAELYFCGERSLSNGPYIITAVFDGAKIKTTATLRIGE